MVDESSDILGGGPIPLRPLNTTPWYKNPNKVGPILVLFVAGYILFRQASLRFLKWQEKSYKLATRRRYGIPDNDHRPFNVAYAAATRERQARNAASRSTLDPQRSQAQNSSQNVSTDGQPRLRFNTSAPNNAIPSWATPQSSIYHSVGTGTSYRSSQYPPTEPNSQSSYTTQPNRTNGASRRTLDLSRTTHQDAKKRAFDQDDDPDSDHAKKTRVEGEEFIDGDEDAGWQDDGVTHRNERGSKRLYADEGLSEDEVEPSKRVRDKRARKVSREHTPEDQIMADEAEVEDDEVAELKAFARGKKRDRVEAGSTFGGDEEERVDDEGYESSKVNRSRKRRTVHKRKSEAHNRGSKRDRNADSYESDGADDDRVKGRARRGIRSSSTSSDDAMISRDPLCKGRRVGEEWEMNGVQYKVGPNGDRLRQALIKKARSKFNMPKDSEHPDRAANMEVYVETWLTEDQYNDAKEQQQLAWQGSGSSSVEPGSSQSPPESPKKVGKDLLWSSTAMKDPVNRRNPIRQMITTNLGYRSNPFEATIPSPSRRVASAYAGPPPDILSISMSTSTGSGTSSPRPIHRSFSKWEKQDLEAEAMRKMRAKAQEQKKAAEEEKCKTEVSLTPAPSFNIVPPTPTPSVELRLPKMMSGEAPAATKPRAETPSLIVPVATKETSSQPSPALPTVPSFGQAATASSVLFPLAPSKPATVSQTPSQLFAPPSGSTSSAPPPPATTFGNPSVTPAAPSLAPKPFFGLNATSTATAPASAGTSATSSAPAPPATTAFSFGNIAANKPAAVASPFGVPAQKETAPPAPTPNAESNPLLARLAPAPAPTPAVTSTPSFFAQTNGAQAKPAATPNFSFAPSTLGGAAPSATTPAVGSSLKFNFGSKPAANTPAPTPASPTPSPFGAPVKPAESPSNPFAATTKPAETTPSTLFGAKPAGGATDKPVFSFGKPGAPASTASTPTTNGSAFSFGAGSGTAFGATTPSTNAFGSGGSLFGGSASTTPGVTTGTTSGAVANGTTANGARTASGVPPALFPKNEGTTPTFTFGLNSGASSAATTTKPAASPMTFKFGSSGSSPSPFGAPAAGGVTTSSPFGTPSTNGTATTGLFGAKTGTSTPAAFGFGSGTGSTAGPFTFGSTPPTPGEKK